ncbi:AAA family ATPase [Serinicoccus marinus]|uniref:AAA family ATPase n=1 Tax=Serinicoccus marinus TaxID=247333 RepID=UPI00052744F5|nr:AAA family ATPase [Serinicoccus marinus]
MLIVLRGNSGSGKSTVARRLQEVLAPHPTAILQQDHFRRVVYRERTGEGVAHAELLEVAARHCLDRGHHVVLDGILDATTYGPMLQRSATHAGDARFFAFDLAFEEMVRRHATRPQAREFGVEEMAGWYHGWQPLPFVEEERITAGESVDQIVTRVVGVSHP